MDYSAVSGEAEHLHGTSPWGSSSPRASRTDFPTRTPESPEPPESPPSPESLSNTPRQPSYHQQHEPALDGGEADDRLFFASDNVGAEGRGGAEKFGQRLEATQVEGTRQPVTQSAASQTDSQSQPRPGQVRQQSTRQQRPVPQYKLQSKITGLERTGRKDPVLRFDVYVRRIPN